MFWGDITKYIRSVLFKKELEKGDFTVKAAKTANALTLISENYTMQDGEVSIIKPLVNGKLYFIGFLPQGGSYESAVIITKKGGRAKVKTASDYVLIYDGEGKLTCEPKTNARIEIITI